MIREFRNILLYMSPYYIFILSTSVRMFYNLHLFMGSHVLAYRINVFHQKRENVVGHNLDSICCDYPVVQLYSQLVYVDGWKRKGNRNKDSS